MNRSKQRQATHKARKRPTAEQKTQETLHKFRKTMERRALMFRAFDLGSKPGFNY